MNMCSIEDILENFNCLPKKDIVSGLVDSCSVEALTCMKMELVDKCKGISGFPDGEIYSRRKPRDGSSYSSLEERLADDIFELLKCFDTGLVAPSVKAMFKGTTVDTVPDESILSESRISISSPSARESGWRGIKAEVVTMQSRFMLFCESTNSKLLKLEAEVESLRSVVKSKQTEIDSLKKETFELRNSMSRTWGFFRGGFRGSSRGGLRGGFNGTRNSFEGIAAAPPIDIVNNRQQESSSVDDESAFGPY